MNIKRKLKDERGETVDTTNKGIVKENLELYLKVGEW